MHAVHRNLCIIMGFDARKSVLGFPTRLYPNQLAELLEILLAASLDMILSNKQITKVLIRLCGCAGWSAPLLFAKPENRISRDEAYIRPISSLQTFCNLYIVLHPFTCFLMIEKKQTFAMCTQKY